MKSSVLLLSILLAGILSAQTNRGAISGSVFDSTGAIVPNASVVIRNLGTNREIKTKTSDSGAYSVLSLDPVSYRLTVEAQGFNKETVENIKVDTATVATVNITLHAGDIATQVTIQAESAQVNTESGTTSTTVNERQIQDIPLVNRSVLDLAMTQPNVMGFAGSEDPGLTAGSPVPGMNLSVNGGRPGSTLMMADGANNTGVSLGRTMVSFSPETVQEFTVQTSAYSAEYSQSGGGIINATTKSGTNDLSGTALWYIRNPVVAAAPWSNASANRPKPTLKYNQFSLTAGGPVYIPKIYNGKNKTFFFGAIEPRYRRDFLAQDSQQPTDAMRSGDFSGLTNTAAGIIPVDVARQYNLPSTGDATIYQVFSLINGNQFVQNPTPAAGQTYLPFPGNIIPKSWLDATAQKALKYITPAGPWYLNSGGGVSNLPNPRLLRQDEKRYTIKIDQTVSVMNRLSFRYTDTPIVKTQYTPSSPTTDAGDYNFAKQYMLSDTHTFSPTVMNELRVNVTTGNFSSTKAPKWEPFTGENLNTELGLPNITPGGAPMLPFIGSGGSTEGVNHEYRYGLNDIVYWTKGKMNWKFGVEISKAFQNVKPLYGASGGNYEFRNYNTDSNGASNGTGGNSFADFMIGVPFRVTLRNTLIPYYYRWNSAAGFVQNDWKVRPNLTLNLGLRYSLQMPRTEKYDHQGVFDASLSKSFPLSTPLTLANGQTVSSVLVPPFAWAGKGGRDRYLYPADYLQFEPRFGFAWSPRFLADRHLTLRGGYGLSHAPVTGAARLPNPDFGAVSTNYGPTQGQVNPAYIMRLGENPPKVVTQSIDDLLSIPSSGLDYLGSLNNQGVAFAISQNVHTPYSQSWNMTVSWQVDRATVMEVAYVGNKGTHLFMPRQNIDPKDLGYLNYLDANNLSTTATIPDPLGRKTSTGSVIGVSSATLASRYLGFNSLNMYYDASANSIRHAAYVSAMHRVSRGLTFTSNFTVGKSIDDASDSGVDKNVLSTGRVDGQAAFGASRSLDRSVSLFDQKYIWNSTFIYDLPFGRGRKLLSNAWKPLNVAVANWTVSGIFREVSGTPMVVTMSDSNQLGDLTLTHTARPNIVSGVPVVNPYFDSGCVVGANCQPYLNPSAFARPPLGTYGNAPRSLDGARGPWQQYFDLSIQKTFKFGEGGKRRIQFRVDALNALNHFNKRVLPNNGGNTDVFSQPSGSNLSTAEYNTWAAFNNQPLQSTPAGAALLAQSNAQVNAAKNAKNVLPVDFFTAPLPPNFFGKNANNFDITTLDGFKYYRLRQALGTTGIYIPGGQARYIQFGLKLYF